MTGFLGRPNEPFFFGKGGRRMSPEDIALQRRFGLQQIAEAGDTSPVGHWTQGLARALGGITGRMELGRADRADSERKSAQQQIAEALTGGGTLEGGGDPIAAALLDPELRGAGMSAWEARQPKAAQPTEFARLIAERDALAPDSPQRTEYDAYISGKSDPLVTVTLPGGGIFVGPQSELGNVLSGGGQQAQPPTTLPPDFFDNEPAPQAEVAQFMTRDQFNGMVAQKGQAWADDWRHRFNVQVRD